MTTEQRLTVQALQSDGFDIFDEAKSVCIRKGNDYRLVMADGSQRRAKGARK